MKAPVLTLLGNNATSPVDPAIASWLADELGATLDWLDMGVAADFHLPTSIAPADAVAAARQAFAGRAIDAALQDATTRRKRALIADMDSTMIDQECIDELAAEVGLKEKVAAITARAMNGEIAFEPALRERVALLEGLPLSVADTVMEKHVTFASGGSTLVATMRAHGAYCALVSGGFTVFTEQVAAVLGFHEHRANVLLTNGDALSGRVAEPILGSDAKVAALRDIAAARGFGREDFVAVGDGANDLPMLLEAGTGVALHAKPNVAARAPVRIDHGDLTALLFLQGYRRSEFINP